MADTKFTPGPWHLCAHLANIDKEIECGCGFRGVIYGPEGIGYAICQPGFDSDNEGEEGLSPPRYDRMTEIANAHLIAASPELYEALEDVLGLITPEFKECPMVAFAKAALAKARGEVV
ncbi:hypothetical protein CEV34_2667 [Brucella pseudogrignonensis]|uniref:Uncharacterized protein n=2 Tax=Brucella pseudogrignonensis TaxID=419475 RepID=A0A256GFA2_9HYPH|nr:hypothetical protein [Brucella pseudogrignonensis]OYR25698.1 hypothetical protein CEV34_2667 [Brucella pseudogrignonensis]